MHWSTYVIPIISGISIIVVAIVDIVTHKRTSNKFDRIVIEELKLKDEQIKTIEEKHEVVLASKVQEIKSLEYYSSPRLREAYDSMRSTLEDRIEQLEITIQELQGTNQRLIKKKEELAITNDKLKEQISKLTISTMERNVLNTLSTDSMTTLDGIEELSNNILLIQYKLIKDADNMKKVTDLDIKVENHLDVSDTPGPDVTDDNDENDDPETPQPA